MHVARWNFWKGLFRQPFLCYNISIHHRQRATRLTHSSFVCFKL
nr:MAG TPA: hypothetical protein [Caudoviricetes sp.]